MANVVVLIAAAITLRAMIPLQSQVQAFAVGWFLVSLQIVLLFQQKDERIYWVLVMLSLLEVVVATSFSQGVWFGAMLLVYMLFGFFAMTLLLLHRQWTSYQPRADGAGEASPWRWQTSRHPSGERHVGEQSPPGWPPPSSPAEPHPADSADSKQAKHRWPLAGEQPEFVGSPGGSIRAAVGKELLGRHGRMGLYTLAMTLVLFFALPRFGQLAWRGPTVQPQRLVGFSDNVALGQLGQIIESRNEVLRVRFSEYRTDKPYPVHGEIYLRGAVLTFYQHGEWQVGRPSTAYGTEGLPPHAALPQEGVVRQKIALQGLDRNELFYVAPLIPLQFNADILMDGARQRLLRPDELCARPMNYELGTTALIQGRQSPLVPVDPSDALDSALQMPPADGPDALPNLAALADRWIQQSGLPAEDRLGRARYLERQFTTSGRFKYSLVGQPRDLNLDPIEDFLTLHREGHCEYFATALVLLLRSQGIPARLVIGYKCDEWNQLGGYYQVRQWHAHAWAEAYLTPSQLPPDLLHGRDYWPWSKRGGWLQLDASANSGDPHQTSSWLTPLQHGMDWLDFMWANYVVEMNRQRQHDAIYQPLLRTVRNAIQKVSDSAWWGERCNAILNALRTSGAAGVAAWGLLAAGALAGLFVLALVGRGIWLLQQRVRRRWGSQRAAGLRRRDTHVEFYRRLEAILAQHGLVRAAGQTQREFAVAAGSRLAGADGHHFTALLESIVNAFYHVRFGCQPLDSPQVQAVEHALAVLATIQRQRKSR
jgi:transglutaminase-like putative cysteine protease